VDHPSSPDAPVEAKARFWVGPLVAGCCFALGYGITERVLTLQTNAEDPVPEAFTSIVFPGDSLQEIRARFSDDDLFLQVDVTALQAASRPAQQAAQQAAQPAAQPAVEETPKPNLALQTPKPPCGRPQPGRTPKPLPPSLMTVMPIPWCFLRSSSR